MKKVKKLISLNTIITQRVTQSGMPYIAFGIFGLFNYPLSYVYWNYINVQSFVSLHLRLVATLLCLGLICKNIWPQKIKVFFPSYWYFTILFSLPFFAAYIALENGLSEAWIMNMLLGLFVFVLLVDWLSFVFLLITGTALGVLLFVLLGGNLLHIPNMNWINAAYMYLFVLVIGGLFSRRNFIKKQLQIQEEKIKIQLAEKQAQYNKQIAGSITHDLRTPLATISNYLFITSDHIDMLENSNGKITADAASLQEYIVLVKSYLPIMDSQINYINYMIDMFLANLSQGSVNTNNYCIINLTEIITKTVDTYPFRQEKLRSLVHLDITETHKVWADAVYIKNIVNNLLRNACYFIIAAGKGEVFIWIEADVAGTILHIKDTAKGASKAICDAMFEPYFSNSRGGTGLGLAFCKTTMESFNGSITAESVEGEYMHFKLLFPLIKNEQPITIK